MAKKKSVVHQRNAPSFKCRLCGEVVKVTKWRKHLSYIHKMGELPRYEEYFDDMPKSMCKCRICHTIVEKRGWRGHLSKRHHIGSNWKFKDYYININDSVQSANRQWYNPQAMRKECDKDWHCGDVVCGPPRVKLIFNALCTNKRKH